MIKLDVFCLCAAWCGTCRDYETFFLTLAETFPSCTFAWIDIENEADQLGDLEIENFPTILIRHQQTVLFFGVQLPHIAHLKRLLETFLSESVEDLKTAAFASAERQKWQQMPELIHLHS